MPKPSKSSASSGTRKKNARKAAGSSSGAYSPPQKSKPSKKQIKQGRAPEPKKSYIPPSKPAPVQVDPLDGMGLAALIPADLVVVLRRLAKKDSVTKRRALEELDVWVSNAKKENTEFVMGMRQIDVLVIMLPVWLHRFPGLSIHSSRRIRHLTASLHVSLLEFPELRSSILTTLRETGSETYVDVSHVLGCWCLSAWDVDRGVAAQGSRSWRDVIVIGMDNGESDRERGDSKRLVLSDVTFGQTVMPFILTAIMNPAATYAALFPLPSTISGDSPASTQHGTPRRGASTPVGSPSGSGARRMVGGEVLDILATRIEDDPESTDDRHARLRVGAMGALKWVLDSYIPTTPLSTSLDCLFSSPDFWTVLHPATHPPFVHAQDLRSETDEEPPPVSVTPEGFGAGQTIVRCVAWGIVRTLVGGLRGEVGKGWRDHLIWGESGRGLISSAILRSAFVESDPVVRSSMWEPLLVFLTKINQAWFLNMEFEHPTSSSSNQHIGSENDNESESSASAHQADASLIKPGFAVNIAANSTSSSRAYDEFLVFLTLGCNGSPIQGYPTVLVILSTIPSEILPPTLVALSEFFAALWAAIDGQALSTLATERAKSTDAFLGAWGECLVWIIGKLVKGIDNTPRSSITVDDINHVGGASQLDDNVEDDLPAVVSLALVEEQFARLFGELGKGLKVDANIAGEKVATMLAKIEAVGRDVLGGAWTQVSGFARATIAHLDHESRGEYALSFLAALHQHLFLQSSSKREVEVLVAGIATEIVERCLGQPAQSHEGIEGVDDPMVLSYGKVLERILEHFGNVLEQHHSFIQLIDSLIDTKLPLLISQPSLILSYIKQRSDATRVLSVWRHLLSTLGSSPEVDLDTRMHALGLLIDASRRDGIGSWAKPQGGELDGLVMHVLNGGLAGDAALSSLAASILKTPGPFINDEIVQDLISTTVTSVRSHAFTLIRDPSAPLETLRSSLGLLLMLEQHTSATRCPSTTLADVMPVVFVLSFVLTQCFPREDEQVVLHLAKQLWELWREFAEEAARETVFNRVKLMLKDLIMDLDVRPRPAAILHSFPHLHLDSCAILEIIPAQSELDALLSSTSLDSIDSSLAILKPLVPPPSGSFRTDRSTWNWNFDSTGLSPYARGVRALLHVLTTDRQAARENMWALRHALILGLFASEAFQVPRTESPVFRSDPKVAETELREISRQTQQTAAFLLTSPDGTAWHMEVTAILSGRMQSSSLDSMGEFVRLVFEHSRVHDAVRDSLVLHMVLEHVFRSATKDDADLWIDLARNIEDKALQTSLAISLAVTEFAPEPPKLDRYRNELASKLAGVPSDKANTTGLRLLRCLSAVAPNPQSDVIFLPQQRTVYLVQTLQAWMGSDEDLIEGVESEITHVLFNLAPMLQHVHGSHWEFVMDLIESNIENSSFKDTDTLVILSRTLHLLTIVEDLATSNKYLRELWNQRSNVILILVRDLLAVKTDWTSPSVPRATCREQALTIVQDLPGSLMDENTLSIMCHLLTDPSVDVQKMSHQLLQQAAIRRTDHLVVEAGVDSDNTTIIELPTELVALLQSVTHLDIEFGEPNVAGQDPFAYLLGWMIAFDLFTDASLRVKTAYVDQLRKFDLIGNYLLPNVFEILSVGGDGERPFKLDAWAVDEFWVSLYDAESAQSLRLLAGHVYYRALLTVPSLVRSWWLELKDRQLSTAVTSFTSSYFSPVLIASELVHIKPSSRAAAALRDESLTDESFNVKVALTVNEVTATFNVDDQQIEIGVRLPAEYPLKTVEIRDIRRVGVRDNLWRKWLFAVQQVVTSQNGRIIDGLSLFKKNVTLHFEGQVECAICYSIISVVDRSLPTKPCKTCKNRFHASCLYKWFNTSHASSCPLCRSDIM